MPKLELPVTISCVALYFLNKEQNLESLRNLDNTLLNHCDDNVVNILLYGSSKYSFLLVTRYCHLLLSFYNLRNVLRNRSFEECLLSIDTWRRSSVDKTSMCCRRNQANAMLMLERRRVFNNMFVCGWSSLLTVITLFWTII